MVFATASGSGSRLASRRSFSREDSYGTDDTVTPGAGRSFSMSRPDNSPARTGQADKRRQNAILDLIVLEDSVGDASGGQSRRNESAGRTEDGMTVGVQWELRRVLARTEPHASGVALFGVPVRAPRNRFHPKRIVS